MYKVTLSAVGNPDFNENPHSNIVKGRAVQPKTEEYQTIAECQKAVRSYIERNLLGGGNWTGGEVYKDNDYVGRISYNGRFWDKDSEYGRRD